MAEWEYTNSVIVRSQCKLLKLPLHWKLLTINTVKHKEMLESVPNATGPIQKVRACGSLPLEPRLVPKSIPKPWFFIYTLNLNQAIILRAQ